MATDASLKKREQTEEWRVWQEEFQYFISALRIIS